MNNKLFDISDKDELEEYMNDLNKSFEFDNISLDDDINKSTKSRRI